MSIQKNVPFTRLPVHVITEKNSVRWLIRFSSKDHVGLLGCVVTFLGVAFLAGSDQVGPRISTSACPGDHVVDGQVLLRTAVLTFIVVALEYVLPRKINALIRGVNISVQADD